jgi:hypothetical protein
MYVRTFLDVLAGGALAEDLREPPVQRLGLGLRLRRLTLVAGPRGIHGARPSVTRSRRAGTASGAPRIGEGGRKAPAEEKVLE